MYQVNFLSWRQQRIAHRKWQCMMMFIIQSGCVLLAITYCFLQQQSQRQYLQTTKTQLEQQLILNQQYIKSIHEKKIQLDQWLAHQKRIDEYLQKNLQQLSILKQLPILTPAKSWLTHVDLTNKHLSISAYSHDFQDISLLIGQIENNPLLHQTQLIKMGKTHQVHYLQVSANTLEKEHE